MKRGDRITLHYGTTSIPDVEIALISPNEASIMLIFEGITLDGHLGSMPILRGEDGVYRSLFTDHPVLITQPHPRTRDPEGSR